jgi:hypothetical protein
MAPFAAIFLAASLIAWPPNPPKTPPEEQVSGVKQQSSADLKLFWQFGFTWGKLLEIASRCAISEVQASPLAKATPKSESIRFPNKKAQQNRATRNRIFIF